MRLIATKILCIWLKKFCVSHPLFQYQNKLKLLKLFLAKSVQNLFVGLRSITSMKNATENVIKSNVLMILILPLCIPADRWWWPCRPAVHVARTWWGRVKGWNKNHYVKIVAYNQRILNCVTKHKVRPNWTYKIRNKINIDTYIQTTSRDSITNNGHLLDIILNMMFREKQF